MGLMSKILGGSSEESENHEENREPAGEALEPEDPVEQEVEEEPEPEPDNEYGIPESELSGLDETLMEVDSPVNYIAGKGSEQRQKLFENSKVAQQLEDEVVDQIRTVQGTHQTARTSEVWAKNPEADELIESVAEDAGLETDEVYEDMSSEAREDMLQELVGRELYEAADTFAVESGSLEKLANVVEQEIGEEIQSNYDDDHVASYNLEKEDMDKVAAVMTSLSEEGKEAVKPEHVGLDHLGGLDDQLDAESTARMYETADRSSGRTARKAVRKRWENEEYGQAALLAETFDVGTVKVEDERSYKDDRKEIEDIASEAVEKFRSSGNYEDAVELAGERPGGVQRSELLEDVARDIESGEEAFQVAAAGYTEEEIMDSAIEYVDEQVQNGNTEAYEQLDAAADYDVQEELSPEAQTDLQLAGL